MTPIHAIPMLCTSWAPQVTATGDPSLLSILAAADVNPIQIGLLVGGIVVLLVVTARQRRSRMNADRSVSRSDQRRGGALNDETLREVEAVMAQLDQLSRQIHGKIDLKLATLQTVIRDADQRIDQLSRLQRSTGGESTFDVELESEAPNSTGQSMAQGPHEAVYRLADSGYTPLQIARELARHTGEVELILSLRRAKAPSVGGAIRKQAG